MENEIKCPKCGEVFKVDESMYSAIIKQIRDSEFSKEIEVREKQFRNDVDNAVKFAKYESEKYYNDLISKKDAEILKLKSDVNASELSKKMAITETETKKNEEIANLKNKLAAFDKDKELEITRLISDNNAVIAEKESFINRLNSEKEISEKEFQLTKQSLIEQYKTELKLKDEQIEQYKDFKAKLSTKMIGETLEQHCEIEFNKLRATGFKNAYFEKDNDVKTGSKGDYIYREKDPVGGEFISIMFEMKNEADSSSKKKKNEDFLKELDKDRNEKKCEYAVLVSLLEPESELYNSGIVDMSHRFEKMYVIRPQFFIPIITLLRNAALNSIEYRKQLELIKNQNIDISNFEAEMNDFKDKFSKNFKNASDRFRDAISEIDKSIEHLQKIKDNLLKSEDHLRHANSKAEDLSIKRLTRNNPTMKAKFEALKLADKGKK